MYIRDTNCSGDLAARKWSRTSSAWRVPFSAEGSSCEHAPPVFSTVGAYYGLFLRAAWSIVTLFIACIAKALGMVPNFVMFSILTNSCIWLLLLSSLIFPQSKSRLFSLLERIQYSCDEHARLLRSWRILQPSSAGSLTENDPFHRMYCRGVRNGPEICGVFHFDKLLHLIIIIFIFDISSKQVSAFVLFERV